MFCTVVLVALGVITSGAYIEHVWYDWHEKRVAVVVPGRLTRGAWQRPAALRDIIDREKIRTVVTLAIIDEKIERYDEQARVLKEKGVRWLFVPMVDSTATMEQMAEAADLLADPELQPVFFHCVAGHHRTSLAHAAYRIRHEGWTAEQALDELARYCWTRPESDIRDRQVIEQFANHQKRIRPRNEAFAWPGLGDVVRR
jgi:protein tyrosine/serine phosphatase